MADIGMETPPLPEATPAPSFQGVINADPAPSSFVAPTQDVNEAARREEGWRERLKNPALQLALLTVGARLASPSAPGMGRGGHIANALLGGATVYAGYNAEAEARANATQRVANETAQTTADVALKGAQKGQVEANTGKTGAETDVLRQSLEKAKQSLPLELDKLRGEVENAKSLDEYRRAIANVHKVEAQIKQLYGGREAESAIALREAQALAARAQAGYQQAHAQHLDAQIEALNDERLGWTASGKFDPNTGVNSIFRYNKKTGESELITEKPALDPAEAIAKARQDVKAALSNARGTFGSGPSEEDLLKQFGGATNAKDAIAFRAQYYQQPRREVMRGMHGMSTGKPVEMSEQDFNMRAGVKPQTLQEAQAYYTKLQELSARAQKEGLTPELDAQILPLVRGLSAAGYPVQTGFMNTPQTAAGLPASVPPAIQAEVTKNVPVGKSGIYKADDGTQWRVDRNGRVLGPANPAPAPAGNAPQSAVQPPQSANQPSGGASASPPAGNANAGRALIDVSSAGVPVGAGGPVTAKPLIPMGNAGTPVGPQTGAQAVADYLAQFNVQKNSEIATQMLALKEAQAQIQTQMTGTKDPAALTQLSAQYANITRTLQTLEAQLNRVGQ